MRRVLEMGHGGFPMGRPAYCDLAFFSRKLPPDTIYFGIDSPLRKDCISSFPASSISPACVAEIESACSGMRPGRIHFLRMDARSTEFMGGFFDEVHLHNVITDPRVTLEDMNRMVAEAGRLLAHGGYFFVSCEGGHVGEERIAEAHFAVEEAGLERVSTSGLEGMSVFHRELSQMGRVRGGFLVAARRSA